MFFSISPIIPYPTLLNWLLLSVNDIIVSLSSPFISLIRMNHLNSGSWNLMQLSKEKSSPNLNIEKIQSSSKNSLFFFFFYPHPFSNPLTPNSLMRRDSKLRRASMLFPLLALN